jgi:hypothetical protein
VTLKRLPVSDRADELNRRLRETPLTSRLNDSKRRIGKMCSEGRPPRMSIPVQYDDDDWFINRTIEDALDELQKSRKAIMHILNRLRVNEKLRYEIGPFTESFENLITAAAAITGDPLEKVAAFAQGKTE